MGISRKIRAYAAQVLQPGESVQAGLEAQTTGYWSIRFDRPFRVILRSRRVIIVTDRRILVYRQGGSFVAGNELLRELPRSTTFGPPHGVWYRTEVLGEPLYISRVYFKDVETADALAPG